MASLGVLTGALVCVALLRLHPSALARLPAAPREQLDAPGPRALAAAAAARALAPGAEVAPDAVHGVAFSGREEESGQKKGSGDPGWGRRLWRRRKAVRRLHWSSWQSMLTT